MFLKVSILLAIVIGFTRGIACPNNVDNALLANVLEEIYYVSIPYIKHLSELVS